jgi:hypothetical protein
VNQLCEVKRFDDVVRSAHDGPFPGAGGESAKCDRRALDRPVEERAAGITSGGASRARSWKSDLNLGLPESDMTKMTVSRSAQRDKLNRII